MTEKPYLVELSHDSSRRHDLGEVRAAIESSGFWEFHDEWRIFTVTSKRIERATTSEGKVVYHVSAICDHEFRCQCPTLEREIETLGIYDGLIRDLFFTFGWPSWASKKSPDS